nr:unnamed protein product [Digitaria exilis]
MPAFPRPKPSPYPSLRWCPDSDPDDDGGRWRAAPNEWQQVASARAAVYSALAPVPLASGPGELPSRPPSATPTPHTL